MFLPDQAECPKSDLSTVYSGTTAPIRTALLFSLQVEYCTSFQPQPISRMDTSILCGYILQGFILTNPWCPPTTTPRAGAPRARSNQRPTENCTARRPTTVPLAEAPRANSTNGRPTTKLLAPKRQRHEQQRRVRAAPAADRIPHDLPPNDKGKNINAACAAASNRPPIARRAPKKRYHEQQIHVRAVPAADRRPHALAFNENGTNSNAACAPHQRPSHDCYTCPRKAQLRATTPLAHRGSGRLTPSRRARPRQQHCRVRSLQTTRPSAAPALQFDRRRPATRSPASETPQCDRRRAIGAANAAPQPPDRTHRLVCDATNAARPRTRTPAVNALGARSFARARKRTPRDDRCVRPRQFT